MSTHYRQQLDWNEDLYSSSTKTIQKWYDGVDKRDMLEFSYKSKKKKLLEKPVKIPDDILEPLYDDLNTPGYIANLHKLFEKTKNGNEDDVKIFISACNFVGLLLESKQDWAFARFTALQIEINVIKERCNLMDKARKNKNYAESDRIRKELLDQGIETENKDGKTTWKLK